MLCQFTDLGTMCSLPGRLIGLVGAIAAPATVTLYLPAHRRGRTVKLRGNRSDRQANSNASRDLFAFGKRQCELRSPLRCRTYAAGPRKRALP